MFEVAFRHPVLATNGTESDIISDLIRSAISMNQADFIILRQSEFTETANSSIAAKLPHCTVSI